MLPNFPFLSVASNAILKPGGLLKWTGKKRLMKDVRLSLLGLDWSDAFGLTSGVISALHSSESALSIGGFTEATESIIEKIISLLKTKYANVFSEQLEKCCCCCYPTLFEGWGHGGRP